MMPHKQRFWRMLRPEGPEMQLLLPGVDTHRVKNLNHLNTITSETDHADDAGGTSHVVTVYARCSRNTISWASQNVPPASLERE